MSPGPHPPFEIRNPAFSLKGIKALVFDLDETLYFVPSGDQFNRYGEYLALFLPEEKRSAYLEALEKAWDDSSPLKIGRAFDPKTGWVLEFDDHWLLQKAYTLEGVQITEIDLRQKYPHGAREADLEPIIHLSSGWTIPTTLARLHGLVREHFRKAYLATRADMEKNPEAFPLVFPTHLPQFFESLKEKGYRLVVATNSDPDHALTTLERLGISHFLDKIYPQARKPLHSYALFEEIAAALGLAYPSILVIGDSVYNDLREAKILGAHTLLIERFPGQPLGLVDARVWNLDGFIELWNAMRPNNGRA